MNKLQFLFLFPINQILFYRSNYIERQPVFKRLFKRILYEKNVVDFNPNSLKFW